MEQAIFVSHDFGVILFVEVTTVNYYDLSEGYYKQGTLTDDEMWSAFSYALSSKSSHSASYKFGFLKSILDNLYEVDSDLRLTFDQLFSKFAEIYWNLILKYNLRQSPENVQGRMTNLEHVLYEAKEKYLITSEIPYESLTEAMAFDINKKVKNRCKANVVGALFGDTQELFYSFSKKGEWIQINPVMYGFVCKHKIVIEKLNYYEWAKYLEKVNNLSADHLLTKIDESTFRNNLSYYRHILENEFETHNCFYCGRKLTSQNTHVDHFIPWSFLKADNTWNFVLSCNTCNIRKNDRLAGQPFLDALITRNNRIPRTFPGFQNYTENKLLDAYHWANNNGYTNIWMPA